MPRPWTVLRHDPLRKIAENLWEVEGDLPGMPLTRRMTVVRLTTGELIIHSAIACDPATMRSIEALGSPGFIVVPNAFHRLDAHAYKERYPSARVVCPRGARKRVAAVVDLDGDLDALRQVGELSVEPLEGCKDAEAVLVVKSADGTTLVFNDVLFNQAHLPGGKGMVLRLIGSTGGPRVTRIFRLGLMSDSKALRAQLERLAGTNGLVRLIPGHGEIIEVQPGAVLLDVARAL